MSQFINKTHVSQVGAHLFFRCAQYERYLTPKVGSNNQLLKLCGFNINKLWWWSESKLTSLIRCYEHAQISRCNCNNSVILALILLYYSTIKSSTEWKVFTQAHGEKWKMWRGKAVINERKKFEHIISKPSLTLGTYSSVITWVILLSA